MDPRSELGARPLHPNPRSVLIVDRDDSILHLCSYIIIQCGMKPYSCWDVSGAFSILSDFNIDLVVTDLEYPGHSGIDLTHHVRTNFPRTPVIVMIPLGDVSGVARALRGGATDYLMKPFSADEFRRQVTDWTQGLGVYSAWARSQHEGLPERRTFVETSEIWRSVTQNSIQPTNRIQPPPRTGGSRRHAAIVADAVRTLQQIIARDVEETAMFAAIDVEELITAFLASVRMS